MLRSYGAAGLLAPAAVDAWSGYRYYSADQLPQARIVAQLRQAGIPVEEIADYFAHPDGQRLERWDREIMQASAARRRAKHEQPSPTALPTTRKDMR